jgi:hypothetical protein
MGELPGTYRAPTHGKEADVSNAGQNHKSVAKYLALQIKTLEW